MDFTYVIELGEGYRRVFLGQIVLIPDLFLLSYNGYIISVLYNELFEINNNFILKKLVPKQGTSLFEIVLFFS